MSGREIRVAVCGCLHSSYDRSEEILIPTSTSIGPWGGVTPKQAIADGSVDLPHQHPATIDRALGTARQ